MIPIGSALAGALMGKPRIPPCGVVLAGAILEIIGVVLLSRISTSPHIDSTQYGFQVLAGLGTGMINAALIILVPYIMEKRDLGKKTNLLYSVCLLTGHSRWFRCEHSVQNTRWTGRPRNRCICLDAVRSPSLGRHRLT
jgi:drug/metabolite transporter (DMT)-like permease